MDQNEFLHNFALQFDDTEESVFTIATEFRELEEWSSLMALSILNMIDKTYGITLTFDEIRGTTTIQDLFNVIKSRK